MATAGAVPTPVADPAGTNSPTPREAPVLIHNRFRIYKFTDFENFDTESFIGYWDPIGKENELKFDSPDVITRGIDKTLKANEEINIFYSVYKLLMIKLEVELMNKLSEMEKYYTCKK